MQLPESFITRTKAILGEEWDAFEKALSEEIPISIRLNPEKSKKTIAFSFPIEEKIEWASNAYYLTSRPVFTLDPLFHAGVYYAQEASSMYLEQIIKKHISDSCVVLDLCAAPGGKSTHFSSLLPENSLLISNDVIRSRADILTENLIKWGNPNTIVTNNDPKEIGNLNGFFDIILTDLPCSGEGMFRKNPASASEWSLNNVDLCAKRQRRIIADIWPALKSDGLLIYSTCTYNREENEENLAWICREFDAEIAEEPKRFMPHQTKGEGFFIAAIRKKGNDNKFRFRNNPKIKRTAISSELKRWLKNPEKFVLFSEKNKFRVIPEIHSEKYFAIKDSLKILFSGLPLGEQKGKDVIPDHALSMSNILEQNAFPIWNLDKNSALKYLKKEAFCGNIPDEIPKGYVLVVYQNQSLGFIKNLGTRANNLYPQDWRIRMNIH